MTLGDVEYGGCKPRIKLINEKKVLLLLYNIKNN